jgi:hypothetical protein
VREERVRDMKKGTEKRGREKGWVGLLEPNSVRGHDDKEIFRQYSKNYIHIWYSIIFRKFAEIFASQGAPPLSTKPRIFEQM